MDILAWIIPSGVLVFLFKSMLSTKIEKMFLARWKIVLEEGILIFVFSFIFSFFSLVFLTKDLYKEYLMKNIFENKLIMSGLIVVFLISFLTITMLGKTKRIDKLLRKKYVFYVITITFILSGTSNVFLLSAKLLSEDKLNLIEDFKLLFIYSILMSPFYFIILVISTVFISKHSPRYKVKLSDQGVFNGLFFSQAIDENRHIYLENVSETNYPETFFLYYVKEKSLYKYERN